ncbi:hypothetical protein ACGFX2_29550 [Streptomyces goshikiensis]|uniref:hypothetical protein n=1 Tax=Streptomyces goshikiensis TaxID=1942 RepID=UPI003715C08C
MTKTRRGPIRAAVLLVLAGALATGCGADADGGGDGRPEAAGRAALAADAGTGTGAGATPDKARIAENVKSALEVRISTGEGRFGSGTNSPCASSSPKAFTEECGEAADYARETARFALDEIDGRSGFATLGTVARKLDKAAAAYRDLGCAKGPAAADARKACLDPAAVVAQGFPDLRSGATMGLAGK